MIAITGVGAVTPFGVGMPALWAGLTEGRSAIRHDARMAALGMRCTRSGRIGDLAADFDGGDHHKLFCRFSRMGWLAALEAWQPVDGVGGVIVGSGVGPIGEIDTQIDHARRGERVPSPGHAVPRVMPSLLPCLLAQHTGAELGGETVSLACNSGLVALSRAVRDIERGLADWYLVGGVEEDNPFIWRSFDQMRALAKGGGEPMSAHAYGFVPAGAAAFVLIESAASARRRGATVLAEIRGCEHTVGGPVSGFSPEVYQRVIARALDGMAPGAIDIVMPHANGTPSDPHELIALAPLRHAAVQLPKARLGHCIGASGLVALVLLAQQLHRREAIAPAPPAEIHPRLAAQRASLARAPRRFETALATSYAFGGAYAAVMLGSAP